MSTHGHIPILERALQYFKSFPQNPKILKNNSDINIILNQIHCYASTYTNKFQQNP